MGAHAGSAPRCSSTSGLRETTKAANKAARGVGAGAHVALVHGSSLILDGGAANRAKARRLL